VAYRYEAIRYRLALSAPVGFFYHYASLVPIGASPRISQPHLNPK
jgi:hypothetical protein